MKSLVLKLAKALATIIGLAYVGAMLFLYFRQEALLFFPEPETPQDAAVFAEFDTAFSANGETLDGWYIPGTSGITVVYYGGNAEELSRRVDNIVLFGPHNYLIMNYRGYGDSSGKPGEANLKSDARAILPAAAERYGFDISDTVVIGRSLGSGVATAIAAQFPVRALILVTPYDSVAAVAQGRYPIFPVNLLLKHPFDSLQYLNDLLMPALIIRADTDRVVPHRHTDNLIAKWQGPLTVTTLPGTHGSVVNSEVFNQTISDFIADQFTTLE